MLKFWERIFTKNLTEIPLFYVNLDYKKYKESKSGSCVIHTHPAFKDDSYLKSSLEDLTDYIRDNYDIKNII